MRNAPCCKSWPNMAGAPKLKSMVSNFNPFLICYFPNIYLYLWNLCTYMQVWLFLKVDGKYGLSLSSHTEFTGHIGYLCCTDPITVICRGCNKRQRPHKVDVLMVYWDCLWMIGLFCSKWSYWIRQSQSDKTVFASRRSHSIAIVSREQYPHGHGS